jgi:hypothetical protein
MNGHGVFVWANGSLYEGEYMNDLPNGPGALLLPNGDVFTGNWVFGCLHDGYRRTAAGVALADCQ